MINKKQIRKLICLTQFIAFGYDVGRSYNNHRRSYGVSVTSGKRESRSGLYRDNKDAQQYCLQC